MAMKTPLKIDVFVGLLKADLVCPVSAKKKPQEKCTKS
ncbi:hypothetical protein JCM19239_3308 [Vibrio variabilis]|uniref:Uncharacterized protein n=1 Tax=Vibrio variabilis TaxID=990271 RepID=A0ABQ0JG16_9VIBR|nr:hypothetical protein JCM19239_3308 [Vibrio variabilis]